MQNFARQNLLHGLHLLNQFVLSEKAPLIYSRNTQGVRSGNTSLCTSAPMDSIFSPHLPFPSLLPRWIAIHQRDWRFHFCEVRRCHHAERSSYKTSLLSSPVENTFGFISPPRPPAPFHFIFPFGKTHVATASNRKCTITRWGELTRRHPAARNNPVLNPRIYAEQSAVAESERSVHICLMGQRNTCSS